MKCESKYKTFIHENAFENAICQIGGHFVQGWWWWWWWWGWGGGVEVNLFSIVSDNGLSPIRCQAITWNIAGLVSIGPLGTNFNEMWIEIQNFHSWKCLWKCHLPNWRPLCPGVVVVVVGGGGWWVVVGGGGGGGSGGGGDGVVVVVVGVVVVGGGGGGGGWWWWWWVCVCVCVWGGGGGG